MRQAWVGVWGRGRIARCDLGEMVVVLGGGGMAWVAGPSPVPQPRSLVRWQHRRELQSSPLLLAEHSDLSLEGE